MKDTRSERRTETALFRYSVIAEALHLPHGEVGAALGRLAERSWDIPGSSRSRIAKQTMRDWMRLYRRAGIDGLKPAERRTGAPRRLSPATAEMILATCRGNPELSVRQIVARVRAAGEIGADERLPLSTVYRLLRREGVLAERKAAPTQDLRRFAAAAACELWQSDVMHGPRVKDASGRKRKTYLLCLLDDATRVIPHGEFRFSEDTWNYLQVLRGAVERRGLPAKLYVDNGSSFRSRQLHMICARLGIAALHARPYHAAGKGKIERFFRTVREQWLACAPAAALEDIDALNRSFQQWLDCEYHRSPHRGLGGGLTPQDAWALSCERARRPEPGTDLADLFLFEAARRVSKARTVSLRGRLYEVEAGLSGRTVVLRHDPAAPPERPIKVTLEGRPAGLARPLDLNANMRVKRGAPAGGHIKEF